MWCLVSETRDSMVFHCCWIPSSKQLQCRVACKFLVKDCSAGTTRVDNFPWDGAMSRKLDLWRRCLPRCRGESNNSGLRQSMKYRMSSFIWWKSWAEGTITTGRYADLLSRYSVALRTSLYHFGRNETKFIIRGVWTCFSSIYNTWLAKNLGIQNHFKAFFDLTPYVWFHPDWRTVCPISK